MSHVCGRLSLPPRDWGEGEQADRQPYQALSLPPSGEHVGPSRVARMISEVVCLQLGDVEGP